MPRNRRKKYASLLTGKRKHNSSPSGKDIAYRILARREHSTEQLRTKLRHRQLPDEEIEAAITRCQRLGFVDDQRWAAAAVREAIRKGKGPIYLRKLLETNNIDPEKHIDLDQQKIIERLLAGPLGRRKGRALWNALLRRGFEPDAIREGLQRANEKGIIELE